MKALAFTAYFVFVDLLILIDTGIAQQATGSLPQVITGSSGGVIILPRQAGSKDAPDIAPATGPSFKLQSDRSESLPVERPAPPNGPGGKRR